MVAQFIRLGDSAVPLWRPRPGGFLELTEEAGQLPVRAAASGKAAEFTNRNEGRVSQSSERAAHAEGRFPTTIKARKTIALET